ncbi:rab GTPase-binding effector protein 2 isoform X1 [Polypterus senegalus]|uniref:rab GTPase-binding effector protein 2 isoform X1 n=1 Tax=Polypterus senegalus TaxID=55291 RepID=UPI0019651D85|nr:rab GTPase-binding effector protein 2 isoform X1 [Polypterus senegalus]
MEAAPDELSDTSASLVTDACDSGRLAARLQAQLVDVLREVEDMRAAALASESTKEQAVEDMCRRCREQLDSLRSAITGSSAAFTAQTKSLKAQKCQGADPDTGQACHPTASPSKDQSQTLADGERDPSEIFQVDLEGVQTGSAELAEESEAAGLFDLELQGGGDMFARNCDSASLASFSLSTPSIRRRFGPEQEDTASVISSGTLVPEAIYIPPPGHRVVPESEWNHLHAEVKLLQASLSQTTVELDRVKEERSSLEEELERSAEEWSRQVALLTSQVQSSESVLQDLQKTFCQSQSQVQEQLAELSQSHRKVCYELTRLSTENQRLRGTIPPHSGALGSVQEMPHLQGPPSHMEERLRIEIINLREQLETRTEMSEVLEVQLTSLKTEVERIQSERLQLESELAQSRCELSDMKEVLAQLQRRAQEDDTEKKAFRQQLAEERTKSLRLQAELDTSEVVQRDFVRLSQMLQVRLEQVRQAESLDQIKEILDQTHLSDIKDTKED